MPACLGAGADPSGQALCAAILHASIAPLDGSQNIAGLLLDRGADPNVPGAPNGDRPLAMAVGLARGHRGRNNATVMEGALAILLLAGADVNAQNDAGNTALHLAAGKHNRNIVGLLLRNGADPNIPNRRGKTALHYACRLEAPACVKMLLEHGASPDAADRRGRTPGAIAAAKDRSGCVAAIAKFRGARVGRFTKPARA